MRPLSARAAAVERYGAPTDQEGSANEPRTRETCGVRWNERWRYREPEGAGFDRVLLFHRYDLVGVFRLDPDGRLSPEPAPEALSPAS